MKEVNKHDLAKELEDLAFLLNKHNLCGDTQPLYQAHGICLRDSNEENWSYKISKLIFRIPTIGHTIPNGADDITLSFSLKVKGVYYIDEKIRNPLTDLEFNVEITGLCLSEDNLDPISLMASWHLDKHLSSTDELTKFIHPEYHMTFGGRKMWGLNNFTYGQSLILPTPRLCHPPMDGILGIDFILQNYLKRETHKNLTDSPEYRRLIGRAQMRLWKPYYLTIANAFATQSDLSFNDCIRIDSLIPNIIR